MRIMMSQNHIAISLRSAVASYFCSARSLPPFLLSCTTNRNISDFDHLHPLESRRDCLKWDSYSRSSWPDVHHAYNTHAFARIESIIILCVLRLSSVYYEIIRRARLSVFARVPYSRPWLHWSLRSPTTRAERG